jgi:alpha,alpha-trehalose phosphorylase
MTAVPENMKNMVYEVNASRIDNASLLLYETLFHNANGYLGVRSNFEEGYPGGFDTIRGTYLNGFYDFNEVRQPENFFGFTNEKQSMPNVADTQGIRLFIGDEVFNPFTGGVLVCTRRLDMAEGHTERFIHWRSPAGKEVDIRIRRLASFVRPNLFLMEYSVKALNFDTNICFVSTHIGEVENYCDPADPRLSQEHFRPLIPESFRIKGTASIVTSRTSRSGLLVTSAVDHTMEISGAEGPAGKTAGEGHGAWFEIETDLHRGASCVLRKYAVFTDSRRCGSDCAAAAERELQAAMDEGPAAIYAAQRDFLGEFWESAEAGIDGDEELETAVRYNLYQLLQSAGRDRFGNVAAKGLSGEGYEGHFFWDTEMYIEPFFALTNPRIARSLISFRYGIIEEARKNARVLGHRKGVLFPWRTIMGRECSGYYPAGTAQYHINADIAWSVVSYYLATGDLDFIAREGAEILFETARLWMDLGHYCEGGFRINEVTGPDEYTCLVNNNYYTNAAARSNLYWAVRFYELLAETGNLDAADRAGISAEEIAGFREAAERMYLPYDEKLGINPQDDSFLYKKKWDLTATPKEDFPLLLHYHPLHLNRFQVCKQADTVLAHFVFEDTQPLETIRRSFLYYEEITTHDSSLSTCIYSIVASKLGFREKALRYFGDSACLDLHNLHGNTKDGIHTANMGGVWMAVVYGFAGLRLKERGLCFAPSLPGPWKGYHFRIRYRGALIRVEITGGEAVFTLLEGDPQRLFVYGDEYECGDPLRVTLRP